METKLISKYLDEQKTKAVEIYDFDNKRVKYSEKIKGWKIDKFGGDEEIVRAYILAKLVNELGYKLENIEIEKNYDIGRPKVNKPRIDVIVRDDKGDAFLFIELKSPSEYEKDKDEIIEKQLFNLASQEFGQGKKVKYLTLYTIELINEEIRDKTLLIDYEKYKSFEQWKEVRNYADELPERYGKAQKEPYVKGGAKDLISNFSHAHLDALRENLHDVLWGGGGTDDNDVFSSLVNIILAKIQDESEKKTGDVYDFQIMSYKDGDSFESNEDLFEKVNTLYRRALKDRLNVDKSKIDKSYVIDENKFSLNKLKYAVSELESISFVEGKNNLTGKDILGDFFEGIIREGFKQSKGQFFTHINIVRFIIWGLQLDKLAIKKINEDQEIPYLIDPSAGSGTFLIEYMRFITNSIKYRFTNQISSSLNVQRKLQDWFYPDNFENKWAEKFIYGSDINFNLGTATKVNMILHGDGSANVFVKDGLLPFNYYKNQLADSTVDEIYFNKNINGNFDVIITNPPFSVDLDNDTKKSVKNDFIFGGKKNSENLFIERYYQLLKPNGRFGIILPESVFDTTENKYIRLFIYKYFKIKAIVSLPQLTFGPYTGTKTSVLFAQKKTKSEVQLWDSLWAKYSNEWNIIKTRANNLFEVYINKKDRTKMPSIKTFSNVDEQFVLKRILKNYLENGDEKLTASEIVSKYQDELKELCKYDKETQDIFGFVNTWWVFGEVAQELNYKIFMAEVDNVGYKRTKRSEKKRPNELYRIDDKSEISVDDGIETTVLDYLRKVNWE